MKKTFKKVVAGLATTAMGLGLLAGFKAAPIEASEDCITTIHIPVIEGMSNVAGWVDPNTGLIFEKQVNNSDMAINWGGDGNNPQYLTYCETDNDYEFVIKGDITAMNTTAIQILVNCDGSNPEYNCKYGISADDANGNVATFNNNTELWATLIPNGQWDGTIKLSNVDPNAPKEETIVHIVPAGDSETIALWVNSGYLSYEAQVNNTAEALNWGAENNCPQFVEMDENGWYTAVVEGTLNAADDTVIQVISNAGTDNQYCCKLNISADDANGVVELYNKSSEVWITLMGSPADAWGGSCLLYDVDPATLTDEYIVAQYEIDMDDALGCSGLDDSIKSLEIVLAAYDGLTESQKALVNPEKLQQVKDKLAFCKAEKERLEEEAAGKLTIYVKADSWEAINLYGWYSDGVELFGGWPGIELSALEKNEGWFGVTFDLEGLANIIFNNGDGEQTVDITEVTAGKYWFVMTGMGEDNKMAFSISTEAPESWVDEDTEEVKPENPGDGDVDGGESSTLPFVISLVAVAAVAAVVIKSRKVVEL